MRDAADLASPEAVGHYAAQRSLARLQARRVPTGEVPVLFEAPVAAGLLGAFVQAISGGALGEGAAIAIAMVPFLLAAILFSYFGLQRRAWQQGGKDA